MGPSGAGKTTLLDILGDRINSGISGEILINGTKKNSKIFKKISAYIMQEDRLQEYLSVEESMRVASDLKCHPSPENCERVKEIIEQLGLIDEKETLTKNLSGGQKKRLAIGLELVNNPPVMFFDEPTSGLGSGFSVKRKGLC